MHRFIEWITDLIDDYGEAFIEAPLKTLSKTVSWIFSIVIGVMSVVAYIKFCLLYTSPSPRDTR